MKKPFARAAACAAVLQLAVCAAVSAQNKKSAEIIQKEALRQETVQDSISCLKDSLSLAETAADRRSLLYFTGMLQEQLGLYTDASSSYAKAAGIAAPDAVNMPKISSEQLAVSAVRASLCAGDWETANSYLNSAIRSSKNEEILATANLYSIWSTLCKASSVQETEDSVALLKAYSTMQSMKSVRPQVLLTLWYLTGEQQHASVLKKEFPSSPEASIINGTVSIMRVPFWYFVPRHGMQLSEISSGGNSAAQNSSSPAEKETVPLSARHPGKKQQLGLFKKKENADELVQKAKAKGFSAYCYSETRSSGTSYFIVAVDENDSLTMGKKLKEAGFDCYTIN
ncbi:MAG: SPOR domain-containing protein [Treponema sp.]|nr:SPOR domain-containing protein [Treponema sp.]